MGRRFKDMQTPEEQWAASRQASQSAGASASRVRPAGSSEWRRMTAYQQAAHLARLDGREDEARRWEQKQSQAGEARPKKRGWFR
ncbi:hypothetical protein [Streptomyces sp. NPDC046985]|uniref:hypothetical protein n=1 Tax=Streptomyces sp. NPDC046985 TaxID=3155377 RepID=UPI0033CFB97A